MSRVLRLSELELSGNSSDLSGATVCFGHFNIIHPGHIRYFRTAKEYGPTLVVALEGDAQLPVNERHNVFPEWERAQSLISIELIDFVVILDTGSLEDFVNQVDLATLVLGREFEEARAAKVAEAVNVVRKSGGKVIYDAGETQYTSLELFSWSKDDLESRRWESFEAAVNANDISLLDLFSRLADTPPRHILVIGDTIVDRYVACDPVGMSNEAPVVVVKELEARDYIGGAGIVAAHIAALGAKSTLVSVTGDDDASGFCSDQLNQLGVDPVLFRDNSRPTTLKVRYLVENQKLFRVSRLKEHSVSRDLEDRLIAEIMDRAGEVDSILVSDFVYGVITPRVLNAIREIAVEKQLPLFGDLQCSSQVGNVLKFQGFSLICPTEREARIALANHDDGVEYVANLLIKSTGSENTILKLGADGFIAYEGRQDDDSFLKRQHFPALSANPIDVTGAGDSLLATMARCLCSNLSVMEASAIACCVSAIAVQTIGNQPISLDQVKRFYLNQHEYRKQNAV